MVARPIKFISICKYYENNASRRTVFENFSCQLPAGRLSLCYGQNGSGKSTFIKLIAGLCQANRGQVLIDEKAAETKSFPVAALLEGTRSLYWRLSVKDNLKFFARLQDAPTNHVDKLVDDWELKAVENQRVETLSAGTRKRLMLVRCLMFPAPILLLDDPLSLLDGQASQLLKSSLEQRLHQGDSTIVVTAHHPGDWQSLADVQLVFPSDARQKDPLA